jgi:nitroreductase
LAVEFQQVVQQRRIVRAFREEPLAPEVVERILANGNRAPLAGFTQGHGFLVLEAAEERARFWATLAAAGKKPEPAEMAAPLLVVPLADPVLVHRHRLRRPAHAALLTAVDQELGGLFFRLAPLGEGASGPTAIPMARPAPEAHAGR